MSAILSELFGKQRAIEVVDAGANPTDGDPTYKPLLAAGLCNVTGFEPLQHAMAQLLKRKGPRERYLPYVIADGRVRKMTVCKLGAMSSLLEPDRDSLSLFTRIGPAAQIVLTSPIQTHRLDDLTEIERIDFLKLDIQGAELLALEGGRRKLASAVAVQVEVSFMPLYKEQPTFADVDRVLRAQGFLPHCFAAVKKWPLAPAMFDRKLESPRNQLLEADMVYVRGLVRRPDLSFEQLGHLALIAHHCFGSYDLALRCLAVLEVRKDLPKFTCKRYVDEQGETGTASMVMLTPQ